MAKTREVWEPRLRRQLSNEDARQIAENVAGFFGLLAEWSRLEIPSPANDPGKPHVTNTDQVGHER